MSIQILPQHLANQIAAGEVVQRPESVVKELVENSIDAGAHSVTVIVREAGKQLIQVIDDGSGLGEDDLKLTIVRHATSKIATQADLQAIRTLGFRGEALASVAAIADVEIRSRRAIDDLGKVLQSRPGAEAILTDTSTDIGTQVLVRNLFYNVPARRKFLKSDLTEFRHISETMQKLALSRPDVRFTFYDGNVLVFDTRSTDLQTRITEILGINDKSDLVSVDAEESGFKITGYVGLPRIARQSRSGQFLFLNGRTIVSRQLSHAIGSAYEQLMDVGQHAMFVLNIETDPRRIDVNVHPQKHEVKFDDERTVYLITQKATTDGLLKAHAIPSFVTSGALAAQPLQTMPSGEGIVNRLTGEIHRPSYTQLPPQQGGRGMAGFPSNNYRQSNKLSAAELAGVQALLTPLREEQAPTVLHLAGRYVVSTSEEGIVVVDQRAAHERILYERFMNTSSSAAEQALLFAVRITLAPSRVALLREIQEELQTLGFRFDVFTDGTVDIHAVPTDVAAGSEEFVIEDILQSVEEAGRLSIDRRRDAVIKAFAAKQALKRGDRLSHDEGRALVADLFACKIPHISPSGKPTYIIVGLEELERRFI